MIKIGDLAKICNVNPQTLRYYDAEGILKPDITDSSSRYRFYSVDTVEKYKKILFYKELGFTLDEIKEIQSADSEKLYNILQKKKLVLEKSIDRFKNQIKIIDELCKKNLNAPSLSNILLLPFENDKKAIGKWQLCGKLLEDNDFEKLDKENLESLDEEIIFMPGGAFAWKYFWTKGILYRLSSKYTFAIPNPYKIIERHNTCYMIIQFMGDECIDNGDDTTLLLYRQVDNIEYTEHQIRLKIDKTDLAFINDEAVLGEWQVYDYIPSIDIFNPSSKYSSNDDIYTTNLKFLPRGFCYKTTHSRSKESTDILRYTKGFVLNDREMTAEKYEIKTIDNKEFLFVEHKSGDYFYGGMTPHLYVFERSDDKS